MAQRRCQAAGPFIYPLIQVWSFSLPLFPFYSTRKFSKTRSLPPKWYILSLPDSVEPRALLIHNEFPFNTASTQERHSPGVGGLCASPVFVLPVTLASQGSPVASKKPALCLTTESTCYGLNCIPLKFICCSSKSQCDGIWGWWLWEMTWLRWGHEDGALMMGLVSS